MYLRLLSIKACSVNGGCLYTLAIKDIDEDGSFVLSEKHDDIFNGLIEDSILENNKSVSFDELKKILLDCQKVAEEYPQADADIRYKDINELTNDINSHLSIFKDRDYRGSPFNAKQFDLIKDQMNGTLYEYNGRFTTITIVVAQNLFYFKEIIKLNGLEFTNLRVLDSNEIIEYVESISNIKLKFYQKLRDFLKDIHQKYCQNTVDFIKKFSVI